MKYWKTTYRLLFLNILILGMIILIGCGMQSGNDNNKSNISATDNRQEERSIENNNNPDKMHTFSGYDYSNLFPLSYSDFSSFRTNNLEFSLIEIIYDHHFNYDLIYPHHDHTGLVIGAGWTGTSRYYDAIVIYSGGLSRAIQSEDPPVYEGFDRIFRIEDVDLIFDYLEFEDNEDYFFNGDEFTIPGLDIPYRTYSSHINGKHFSFTLTIYKPNSMDDAWVISKCMDEPDPIMLGLIDILEEHFISQFE